MAWTVSLGPVNQPWSNMGSKDFPRSGFNYEKLHFSVSSLFVLEMSTRMAVGCSRFRHWSSTAIFKTQFCRYRTLVGFLWCLRCSLTWDRLTCYKMLILKWNPYRSYTIEWFSWVPAIGWLSWVHLGSVRKLGNSDLYWAQAHPFYTGNSDRDQKKIIRWTKAPSVGLACSLPMPGCSLLMLFCVLKSSLGLPDNATGQIVNIVVEGLMERYGNWPRWHQVPSTEICGRCAPPHRVISSPQIPGLSVIKKTLCPQIYPSKLMMTFSNTISCSGKKAERQTSFETTKPFF